MEKPINYISVNDWFWFQIHPHLISFGSKQLPKDIHYTISFNENSPDINFHVTKNSNDAKTKPKIAIVVISKKDLDSLSDSLVRRMLKLTLKPFDIEDFRKRNRDKINFLSFEKIQNGELSNYIENELKEGFKPISKIKRKTRLKINGDIESHFESFATSTAYFDKLKENMTPLKIDKNLMIEGGIILSAKESITIIRIDENWFEINLPKSFTQIIASLTNETIAQKLTRRTKRAIIKLKHAKSYEDVKCYDLPPRLNFNHKK